jgi:hypothetical protein
VLFVVTKVKDVRRKAEYNLKNSSIRRKNMSRGKKIALGIFMVIALLCGAFMLFVNWANSDEGQATFKEVGTRQAIESATANAQHAAESETATAVMTGIDQRIKNAKLVFQDDLKEGSPFIAANIQDHNLKYEDGEATIRLTWDGFSIWESGKQLKDFIAELDCANYGDGISCGFAYGVHKDKDIFRYYGSTISGGYKCGFFDITTNFSASNYPYCNYPHSSSSWLQHLRLEKFGANVRFYVNEQLMDQRVLEDPNFLSGGVALLIGRAGGEQSEMNEVRIQNFKVWEIP